MKKYNHKDMKLGWFVGDFIPSAFKTKNCEVAVKNYSAGDSEENHLHKVATEITLILNGKIKMNKKEFSEGDIIIVEPNESVKFEAITDVTNVVVKIPSVKGDKYIVKNAKK